MNIRLVLLGLPFVLLVAVVAGISSLPQAHASGFPSGPGTVCLLDSSAVSSLSAPGPCQSFGPYTFDGPYPSAPQSGPTEIRVGVYVNGSGGLNAFDIILASNSSVLQPVGFDLTGSVLLNPQVIAQCQGLVPVQGSSCNAADTSNTFEVSVAEAPGSGLTAAPTTGLLFTAIYNIIGVSPAGGISVEFLTGCSNSSVPNGACVTIANGSPTPVSETVQTGTLFNNSVCATTCTVPWVAVTTNSTTVTVPMGASSGAGVAIIPLAENVWPGQSTDSISFVAVASAGFSSPTFSSGNSCSPGGTSTPACPVILTVNSASPGTYSITIYGTYVAFDTSGVAQATNTLVGTTVVHVNVEAVAWSINSISSTSSQILYMGTTSPVNLLFTAQSLGGYSGTITYQTNTLTPGVTGISFTYPASFVLGSGQTITQTVVANAAADGTALYHAALITSAPTLLNQSSATLIIHVTGFSLTAATTSLTIAAFSSASDSVTVQSLPASTAGFAGKVTLSKTITGGPLTVTCPASMTLTAGGSASGTCTFSATVGGNYTVVIKGTGGTNNAITNTTTIQVTVTSTPKSISLTASPSSLTSPVNSNPFSRITVVGKGGLTGTMTLSVAASPATGITCTLSNTGIPTPKGNSTLSCNSADTLDFTVVVTASDGSVTNSVALTFTFTDFSVSASPSIVTTLPGVTGSSAITIVPTNGFADNVSLALSVSPNIGLACALAPTTITGGSGNSTLNCAGIGGTYAVTVMGTDHNLAHATTATTRTTAVMVNVADFAISASPSSITVPVGPPAGTTMITVVAVGGFAGTVTFNASTPAGFSTIFAPSTVTIAGTSLLTIGVSPPAVPGTYLVNVTGTSGTLTHTVTIAVTVTAASAVLPPVFTQATWDHRFSLSKYNDVQTWRFGVQNNSTSTTIYFSVTITGTDTSGTLGFTQSTGVFTEQAGKNLSQLSLSQTFSASDLGDTFSFTMVIHWATTATTNPADMPFTSTLAENGIPTSGSFTILP